MGRRHRMVAAKGESGIMDGVAVPMGDPFSAHSPMCGEVQSERTVAELSFFSMLKRQYDIGGISIGRQSRD